uniref:Uncharacterized protein n=1 Tax=Cyprinus carpio TaxID=7962 RepID=A0A8C1WTV5_CYPCA
MASIHLHTSTIMAQQDFNNFQYGEEYLQVGFTVTADLRPQCVVFAEVLANNSMKPSKLKRHLETKHAGIKNKPAEYFNRKLDGLHQQQAIISVHSTVSKQCLEASYVVAKSIGKLGKPHTVARRIEDMSNDIREQLIEFVKRVLTTRCSWTNPLKLLGRHSSSPMSGICGTRRLRRMSCFAGLFSRTLQEKPFSMSLIFLSVKMVWLRTDALAYARMVNKAMTGRERCLAARVQQVAPLVKWTHCMVHCEALAAKKMPVLFDSMLNQSMKMINLIKSGPLISRLFGVLLPGHEQLLLHTEVRWLSRGRVLQRLYELREEVKWFLTEIKSDLANHLDDTMWLAFLSYLVNKFDRLNGLNLSLQGRETHILLLADKVHAFTQKLDLWHDCISRGNCDMFPSLADFITDAGTSHNPFVCTANELSTDMQEQLIELKSYSRLKELFSSCPLSSFWAALVQEYAQLCDAALKILLPFTLTYLCEAGFSKMTALKTKYRNRAQIEDDLRLSSVKNIGAPTAMNQLWGGPACKRLRTPDLNQQHVC